MLPRTRVCVHVCVIVHRHVGIRVCSVHTPTLTPAPSHLPLHTCVHTQSTYPHPDTCSTHVHTHRHPGGNFPPPSPHSPTSPHHPDCWKSYPSATHACRFSQESVRGRQHGVRGCRTGGSSHPGRPPAGASVCAAAPAGPRPRSQRGEGAGRATQGRGRAATGPNQKFHTPIGTRPLCKARTQLGESPKLALFTAADGRGPSPGQSSEGRAQTRPSLGSSSPESCSPSWGPCRGRPAGPERASESPPPLALSQALSVKGEAVASRHISLQQAVVPSVAEHGCF